MRTLHVSSFEIFVIFYDSLARDGWILFMISITSVNRNTISDVIRRSATRVPDKTAIVFDDRTWTYAELESAVTSVARHLVSQGLEKGDRVAAFDKNSDLFAILFLACTRAGLIHVPINYQLTREELEYMLENSGAKRIYVGEEFIRHVQSAQADNVEVVPFAELVEVAQQTDVEPSEPGEFDVVDTDIAQLLYTSGTTSLPKGAIMTHRALLTEYQSALLTLDHEESDRWVHALPLYHSAQMHVLLIPSLMKGSFNIIVPAPVTGQLLEIIEREKITSFFAAPTVWVAIAHHPDLQTRDLSSLKRAMYGASIMPGPILKQLRETLPNLGFYNCMGQSELGPLAIVLRPEEHDERPDFAGRPVPFVETRLADPEGIDVAPGEQGEILYRSPQLCLGYWEKPEATEEAFAGGWFHSGDLAVADEQGYIKVVDRVKDVINTGGVLVAGRQVEDSIFELDAVEEVAVVGQPDEKWIEAITAYVVVKEGQELDETTVIEHVKERLAAFKAPKAVHFVDALPKNSAGKILKRKLRES